MIGMKEPWLHISWYDSVLWLCGPVFLL